MAGLSHIHYRHTAHEASNRGTWLPKHQRSTFLAHVLTPAVRDGKKGLLKSGAVLLLGVLSVSLNSVSFWVEGRHSLL